MITIIFELSRKLNSYHFFYWGNAFKRNFVLTRYPWNPTILFIQLLPWMSYNFLGQGPFWEPKIEKNSIISEVLKCKKIWWSLVDKQSLCKVCTLDFVIYGFTLIPDSRRHVLKIVCIDLCPLSLSVVLVT